MRGTALEQAGGTQQAKPTHPADPNSLTDNPVQHRTPPEAWPACVLRIL